MAHIKKNFCMKMVLLNKICFQLRLASFLSLSVSIILLELWSFLLTALRKHGNHFLVSLDKKYGNLKLFSNVALIDARYTRWDDPAALIDASKDFSGNFVENVPRNINRFGLSYKYNRFSFTYQFNQVSSIFTDALNTEKPNSKATTGKLVGYTLMDISATYLINGKYNIKAGVNNLMNEKYATRRSGGYPGPGILPGNGRTFFVSIGAKF